MRKRQSILLLVMVSGFVACAGRSLDADTLFNELDDKLDSGSRTHDSATTDVAHPSPDVHVFDGGASDVWTTVDGNAPDVQVVDAQVVDAQVVDANVPDVWTVVDANVVDGAKPDASDGGTKDASKPDATPTENSNAACSDGFDNDGDGFADCYDYDCWKDPVTVCSKTESTNASCSDGIDNDGDGYTDCDDYGCSKNVAVTVCNKDAGKNDAQWWAAWGDGGSP